MAFFETPPPTVFISMLLLTNFFMPANGFCQSPEAQSPQPVLVVLINDEGHPHTQEIISAYLAHTLPLSDFAIHQSQDFSQEAASQDQLPFPKSVSNWLTEEQSTEEAYFNGQFQKVISKAETLTSQYEFIPSYWSAALTQPLIRMISFKALSRRALGQSAEYNASIQFLLETFPFAEFSSEQFPDYFLADIDKIRTQLRKKSHPTAEHTLVPPVAKSSDTSNTDHNSDMRLIDHHLPIDTVILSNSDWGSQLPKILSDTHSLRVTYPQQDMWIFHSVEPNTLAFCAFYHRLNQWECEHNPIQADALERVLPLLYKNYVATQINVKSMNALYSSSNPDVNTLDHSNSHFSELTQYYSTSSSPWWLWAAGAALAGGAAIVFTSSLFQNQQQSSQVTGTIQLP